LSLMNMLVRPSSVHFVHIGCYQKFYLLHYTQVLCQPRLGRVDHAYLTYLMLQRQLNHLNPSSALLCPFINPRHGLEQKGNLIFKEAPLLVRYLTMVVRLSRARMLLECVYRDVS
jgi:hypothetical protein